MWFSDELKNFFSKYGNVVEHEIIRDHATKRSRGFGFIVFDNDKVVDNLLSDGNMIDMAGTQVSYIWYFRAFENSNANYEVGVAVVLIGFYVKVQCCEINDGWGILLLLINVMSLFVGVLSLLFDLFSGLNTGFVISLCKPC